MLNIEFLRTVFDSTIIAFRLDGNTLKYFTFNGEYQSEHQINIYEFINKCMKWALQRVSVVNMAFLQIEAISNNKPFYQGIYYINSKEHCFVGETPLESIINMCKDIIEKQIPKKEEPCSNIF